MAKTRGKIMKYYQKLKHTIYTLSFIALFLCNTNSAFALCDIKQAKGTGDLGLIIERASGSILIINHSLNSEISPILCRITGLGDLSHASAVFFSGSTICFYFWT